MTNSHATTDPTEMPLDELRTTRQALQHDDDVVSYARRVAQARLDLVKTELDRRDSGPDADLGDELKDVLSQHLTTGSSRPPRPTEDLTDNPLADELDAVCAEYHFGRLEELDADELVSLSSAISEFESRVSNDRRERFERIDALSAELVRRYRTGEASVDALLNDES